MSAIAVSRGPGLNSSAKVALKTAARLWLVVAIIGQLAFLAYIVAFYGPSTLSGNYQLWAKNPQLLKGYVPGDTVGNLTFAAHALLAGVIMLGGAIQLIPQIRARAMAVHRWSGRIFFVTALGLSLSGLSMEWIRGDRVNLIGAVAVSLNAVLIILCCALAWRFARAHDVAQHRRWALRSYLVANAQWFTRVGIFAWILANRGPVGIGSNFDGPVVVFWAFGCYLVPLAVLELYFLAERSRGALGRFAMAGLLVAFTLATLLGIGGVAIAAWIPTVKAAYDPRISIAQTLSATIASSGVGAAAKQYEVLKKTQPARYNFAENELNGLGYNLLRAHRNAEAIRIFELNVEAYPQSSNVYDSLAEAYMDDGKRALAIAGYQRSLQLDPKNQNAVDKLKALHAP